MGEVILYFIALILILFATVHDLKKREVANWLNYSLLAIALIGKAFISVEKHDVFLFVYSLIGMGIFYGIALAFYYSRVFAGGDAKLLIGIGAILPYHNWMDISILGGGFILLLLFVGASYTVVYSLFLAGHSGKKYLSEFSKILKENRMKLILWWIVVCILLIVFRYAGLMIFALALLFICPLLFVHLKSVEKSCLIVNILPSKLTEGDWLLNDVKVFGKVIKNSVHGLNKEEILLLKKAGKKVWIRQGIPFVPAFLGVWIIMGFFFLWFGFETEQLFSLFLEFFGAS